MTRSKLESDIVSEAHDYAIIRGWWTIKVESPTKNGIPDRLYLRRGVYVWIEWKKPGGTLRPIQVTRIAEMKKHGATVYVFDNLNDAKAVLK
jgi:hypothetical protein